MSFLKRLFRSKPVTENKVRDVNSAPSRTRDTGTDFLLGWLFASSLDSSANVLNHTDDLTIPSNDHSSSTTPGNTDTYDFPSESPSLDTSTGSDFDSSGSGFDSGGDFGGSDW